MIHRDDADLVPLEDFVLAWRITDPRWSSHPAAVLDRIKPLSDARSRALHAGSPLGRAPRGLAEAAVVREQSLAESGDRGAACYRWFRELPIDPSEQVYLCWEFGRGVAAIIIYWGTFLETWDDLWYPFDSLCAFDDTGGWAVVFGPGEVARYLEKASASFNG